MKRRTDEAAKYLLLDQLCPSPPYLYATGLFDRAWPQFRAPVETHVQAFIDGKITLEQMAANLAAAVP
jgi:hypothetical protein